MGEVGCTLDGLHLKVDVMCVTTRGDPGHSTSYAQEVMFFNVISSQGETGLDDCIVFLSKHWTCW